MFIIGEVTEAEQFITETEKANILKIIKSLMIITDEDLSSPSENTDTDD